MVLCRRSGFTICDPFNKMSKFYCFLLAMFVAVSSPAQQASVERGLNLAAGSPKDERLPNGSVIASLDGYKGLLDSAGAWIIPPRFQDMHAVTLGDSIQIVANEPGRSGVFNLNGDQLIPCVYDSVVFWGSAMEYLESSSLYFFTDSPEPVYVAYGDGVQLYDISGMPKISDPRHLILNSVTRLHFENQKGFLMLACGKNGKCALMNGNYQLISEFEFDPTLVSLKQACIGDVNSRQIYKPFIQIRKDSGVTFLDLDSFTQLGNFIYDSLIYVTDHDFIIANGWKDGLKYIITDPEYRRVEFNEAFKYSVIDSAGRSWHSYRSKPEYAPGGSYVFEKIENGPGNFKIASSGDQRFIISKYYSGKLQGFDTMYTLNDDSTLIIEKYGKQGIVDENGDLFRAPRFRELKMVSDDILVGKYFWKYGLYAKNGKSLGFGGEQIYWGEFSSDKTPFTKSGRYIQERTGKRYYIFDSQSGKALSFYYTELDKCPDADVWSIASLRGTKSVIADNGDSIFYVLKGRFDDVEFEKVSGNIIIRVSRYYSSTKRRHDGLYSYCTSVPEKSRWLVPEKGRTIKMKWIRTKQGKVKKYMVYDFKGKLLEEIEQDSLGS